MTTLMPKFEQTGASINRPIDKKLAEWVSVKDFGAIGDGVANDTTAIQNAIDTGHNIYFPEGEYIITTELSVSTTGQALFGDSYGNTIIYQNNVAENGISVSNANFTSIKDISLIANGTNTKVGLLITNGCINSNFKNIKINNFNIGIECLNSNQTYFDTIFLVDNLTYNMQLRSNAGSCIDTTVMNGYIAGTASTNVNIIGAVSGIYFTKTQFQLATSYGLQVNLNSDGSPNGAFFTQCIFDTNPIGMKLTAGLLFEFNNCWWSCSGDGVQIDTGMADVRIIGGELFNCGGHGIKNSGTRVQIVGTSIRGAGKSLANTYDGIRLNSSTQTTITGVSFDGEYNSTNVTRYGISLQTGGVNNTYVTGCTFGNMATGDYIDEAASVANNIFLAQNQGGSALVANGATSTLYTFPSQYQGNYLFFAGQVSNTTGGIRAMAYVRVGSSSIALTSLVASASTLSASGMAVQITNSAGGDVVYDYSWIKV